MGGEEFSCVVETFFAPHYLEPCLLLHKLGTEAEREADPGYEAAFDGTTWCCKAGRPGRMSHAVAGNVQSCGGYAGAGHLF